MPLADKGYKRAALIAGAVGVVGACAYVYVKRTNGRRAQIKKEKVEGGDAVRDPCIDPNKFFEDAVSYVNKHGENLPNQAKLQLYALFKQSTVGPCNTSKPSLIDQVGRAKWDAWNGLGIMPQELAKLMYLEVTAELFPDFVGEDDGPN
eukprot:CAMPEP_0118944790 /NCGR_PEP_ID=MMETSP1169-20130426/41022_1 /TAXON_ID=36882 /ORGANISM="Pyramimonas obovata, Strain CCMP722" /LENGTH=148 /DNA_ID=CAMNT_0006890353 /DNA_START=227 /DNA_END=670 /DNA_ORIENTATION=+